MTNEEYTILVSELQADPLGIGYANMIDDEVAASLNEPRFRVPTTRFITWRAIAAVLDDEDQGNGTLIGSVSPSADTSSHRKTIVEALELTAAKAERGPSDAKKRISPTCSCDGR